MGGENDQPAQFCPEQCHNSLNHMAIWQVIADQNEEGAANGAPQWCRTGRPWHLSMFPRVGPIDKRIE